MSKQELGYFLRKVSMCIQFPIRCMREELQNVFRIRVEWYTKGHTD